jgi:hypothetical protein
MHERVMNARLVNDTAIAMAKHLLEIVENCIRPEDRQDAFGEFFNVCVAGIRTYEQLADRMDKRLRPGSN